MPQIQTPQYVTIPYHPFDKGVDSLSQKSYLPQGFVSRAQNVYFNQGAVSKRKGFGPRSSGLPTNPVQEVLALLTFWPAGGVEHEIAVLENYTFKYSYGAGTLSSLFQNNAGSAEYPCMSGDSGNVISWCLAPINKAGDVKPTLVWTDGDNFNDGVDENHTIYHYDGTTHQSDELSDTAQNALDKGRLDLSTFMAADLSNNAKQIIWFADHFFIGDFVDGTAGRLRNAVAWGDDNELGIGNNLNDTSYFVISEARGYMKRMTLLGPHMAIYFDRSITICDPVPTDEIYTFDTRVQGNGLLAPNAIVDIGGLHIFLGQDDLYIYDGGFEPVQIGTRIMRDVFKQINPNKLDSIFTMHLPKEDLAFFFYPRGDSDRADAYFVYNYRDKTFSFGQTAHKVICSGFGSQTIALQCDDSIWGAYKCDRTSSPDLRTVFASDLLETVSFQMPTLGTSDGYIMEFHDQYQKDYLAQIEAGFDTDYKAIGESYGGWGRVSDVHVEMKGAPTGISYSTDFGNSWTFLKNVGDNSEIFKFYRIATDIHTQFLGFRFNFDVANASTEVRGISVRIRVTSYRGL